jgi:hypothetical protein
MNIYQKKLTKVSKLFGIHHDMVFGKECSRTFNWYRSFYNSTNEIILDLSGKKPNLNTLKEHIENYKNAINDNIIETYKQILEKDKLTECEKELAIEIAYLKYSKRYKSKKQFKKLKKWNKLNRSAILFGN